MEDNIEEIDPTEWGPPAEVVPKPSGMGVFSLRLPSGELAALRDAAKGRSTTVSDMVRSALRYYLGPTFGEVSFSASESDDQGHSQISYALSAPRWVGGQGPVVITNVAPIVTPERTPR